jgi:hypothetical protein
VIACLYDVHGNLPALEAVLTDLGEADRYIFGSDYALMGGWPAETVTRLRELAPSTWIRGNADRWLADPPEQLPAAVDHACAQLGDALSAELAALPETEEDGDTLVCDASPVSDMRSFLSEPAEDGPELDGRLEHRRVAYDHMASAAKVRSLGDWAEVVALRIERAKTEG